MHDWKFGNAPEHLPKSTKKSPGIERLLTSVTGKDRGDTIRAGKCTTCNNSATDFKDALSVREYQISGMCQKCQDGVFT